MNRDAPPEDSVGHEPGRAAESASWLRRLYELETALEDGAGARDPTPPGSPDTERSHSGRAAPEDSSLRRRSGPTQGGPTVGRPADNRAPQPGSPLLEGIRDAAGLDGLCLVGKPSDHPFGRVVRARAVQDGRPHQVSLRLFRQPDAEEDGFESALSGQLDRWREADDVDGVVPLHAAADAPRPWACTPPVGAPLAARDHRSLARALSDARSLAHALAGLHDRGVVHAGIDPTNVVYADDAGPLLDNVGLVDVYRRYADPASVLDPRYAAPEYFESDRGIVDRATDVYHLGAVLFRLLTGVAPYDGSAGAVREAVLSDEPVPAPSTVEPRVPEAMDRVVARATAPEKFERFESGAEVARAVDRVCEQFLG